MKKICSIGLILIMWIPVQSQGDATYIDIVRAESELKTMFDKLYNEEVPGSNLDLYHIIDSTFQKALELPGSFDYAWRKLDKIGKLSSSDGEVKVFSWLYMTGENDYHYSAYIQLNKRKEESESFKLITGNAENIKSENYNQQIDDWHGKIYYEMVTTQFKRKVFYTLIGADFNNSYTTMKTMEVFAIQRGKPVFRSDQFMIGGTVKDRIVLEYSADLSISVRYNNNLNMIVFDHLAPLHPIYTGNYQFYGPDGSYDGLKFEEGIWILEEDVDARNR